MHRSVILVPTGVTTQNYQLFSPSDVPATFGNAGQSANLATAFRVTAACSLVAFRFYRGASETSTTHTLVLWDLAAGQANLRQIVSSGETGTGWKEFATSPLALTVNHDYYVGCFSPNPGYYSYTSGYFSAPKVSGPITAYQDGQVTNPVANTSGNGAYAMAGTPTFPIGAGGGNYWVDVVVQTTSGGPPPPTPRTYSTIFPAPSENPISESANWINGAAVGLDWTDCRKTTGFAFGTMSGTATGDQIYADSTAILSGTWAANQQAQATIKVVSADSGTNVFQEVELRLRSVLSAHVNSGYEINCSISPVSNNFYFQIIKWLGPINSYTELDGVTAHGVDGDVIKATIVGNLITGYLNNSPIITWTDNSSPWTSGAPGMGFFVQNKGGIIGNFGFSAFSATEL